MAVSLVTAPGSPALFNRVSDKIFRPLASPNRHLYWGLLCHLFRTKFGPDAPLPASYGVLQREILSDIEDFLRAMPEWHLDPEDVALLPETPLSVRSNAFYNSLLDAGWLRQDRYGIEKTVNMPPGATQLLTDLITFAETGPVHLSGKIRSIDAAITQVLAENATGDLFREAADQARSLLNHIRRTGITVRDLMSDISAHESTAMYVRTFFQKYIQDVFIGDYKELRTREHPLSRRSQILDAVYQLDTEPKHRARLLEWYVTKFANGDATRGSAEFARDLRRLYDLERIEEYLERLDFEISSANKRALAYLDYKLRSIRPIDELLRGLVADLAEAVDCMMLFPLGGPDELMGEARLAQPRKVKATLQPSELRRAVVSDRTLAKAKLKRAAASRRAVTPLKLRTYVHKAFAPGENQVDSVSLPCSTIEETCGVPPI